MDKLLTGGFKFMVAFNPVIHLTNVLSCLRIRFFFKVVILSTWIFLIIPCGIVLESWLKRM
jgi:hypothetical protein